MADRWIITRHAYVQHRTLAAAKAEHARLQAKVPDKTFRIHRIKTTVEPSGTVQALIAALQAATRELISERDTLYDSITNSAGEIVEPADGEGLAELDAVIDQCRAALAMLSDDGACPHDPDGQHFTGCGCEDSDVWTDPRPTTPTAE